jgi:hypothetical protein
VSSDRRNDKILQGKELSESVINEIFAQVRSIQAKLNWPGVKEIQLD